MTTIILLLIIVLVFGGGGYGWRAGYLGSAGFGSGIGGLLVVLLVLWLLGII